MTRRSAMFGVTMDLRHARYTARCLMELFDRIFKVHQILVNARHPVSRARLQDALECSPVTVKRVIGRMRDYLRAPIQYDRSHNGYFYALEQGDTFELPGLWLNASELHALLACDRLLSDVQPGLLTEQLTPLKERIDSILSKAGTPGRDWIDRVRILHMGGRIVEPHPFESVASALVRRRRLSISYHGRSRDAVTHRTISPQRLVHYRDNWYVDAWCHDARGLRTFSLDRIHSVRAVDLRARIVAARTLDAHLATAYGIFSGKPKYTAVLQFTAARARWVADEQWHPAQQGRYLEDGSYELRLPYGDPRELIMDILKYGDEVEVRFPASLRAMTINKLAAALSNYRKDR